MKEKGKGPSSMKDLKTMRTVMMKEYLSGKTECVPAFRRSSLGRSVKPYRAGCPVRGGWHDVAYAPPLLRGYHARTRALCASPQWTLAHPKSAVGG